jgi:hypothetical protein
MAHFFAFSPNATTGRQCIGQKLSWSIITGLASAIAWLIDRDTLADINPTFELDTEIVAIPPEQSAFSN